MKNSKQKRILIIDDEKPMARALELKLSHSGFEAKSVHNGEEALALLKKESFNLILLDLVMPKLDGFNVLQALKNRKNATPIIILSNLGQEEDEKRARDMGAKDFFIKSNTPIAEIVEKVKIFLNRLSNG